METFIVIRGQSGEGANPAAGQDPGERNEGEDQPLSQQPGVTPNREPPPAQDGQLPGQGEDQPPSQQPAATPNVEPPPRREDQSNLIPNMNWSAAFNLTSNLMDFVVTYLRGELQGIHKRHLRAALTASVGVPIGVALSTFCFSYLVASDARTWKKWITGLTTVNVGMTVGGPLSFNCLRK